MVRERAYLLWQMDNSPRADADEYWRRARRQHLQERAYVLWQQEGCPSGKADDHWYRTQEYEFRLMRPALRAHQLRRLSIGIVQSRLDDTLFSVPMEVAVMSRRPWPALLGALFTLSAFGLGHAEASSMNGT